MGGVVAMTGFSIKRRLPVLGSLEKRMLNVMENNSTLMFPWIVEKGKSHVLSPKTEEAGVLRLSIWREW